ncbi:MAG: amidohydrolase family protein [Planctomycetia bacterium]
MKMFARRWFLVFALVLVPAWCAHAEDVKKTEVYARIKAKLDAVPAIDTHGHFLGHSYAKQILERDIQIEKPKDCILHRFWTRNYFVWGHHLAPWPEDGKFETWWKVAEKDFENSRARSAYRAELPVFKDLYGVDYDTLTLERAKDLNARMEKNFADPDWAEEIIVRRANTQLVIIDSFIMPNRTKDHYPFTVSAYNVTYVIHGFHPSEFGQHSGPYAFAAKHKLPVKTLDDYVNVLDQIVADAKKRGAVCLKSASAYFRTLKIEPVSKKEVEKFYGRTRKELTPSEVKKFQDYIFWQLARLAAKHQIPFQIHTGHAKIPGSNPMNLVPFISGNRKTTFVLFHGGFPWIEESGMVALKYPNVYLDSVWMPTLSYSMGKQGFREWLEMISSNRIMWGSDLVNVEGSYGTTKFARQCIYEALAEMVIDDEIREEDALRIGRQILRENALNVYPTLRERVEKEATAK